MLKVSPDEVTAEECLTPLEKLIEALAEVTTSQEFWRVVQGYSAQQIEDSIAMQNSQSWRKQLTGWYEAGTDAVVVTSDAESLEIPSVCLELSQALKHGIDALKAILEPLSFEARWEAVCQWEDAYPAELKTLEQIEPNWVVVLGLT